MLHMHSWGTHIYYTEAVVTWLRTCKTRGDDQKWQKRMGNTYIWNKCIFLDKHWNPRLGKLCTQADIILVSFNYFLGCKIDRLREGLR